MFGFNSAQRSDNLHKQLVAKGFLSVCLSNEIVHKDIFSFVK